MHHDKHVLDSLSGVESYMLSEATVKTIVKTVDEKTWCTLSARADGKVLAKKLGKEFKTIFEAA